MMKFTALIKENIERVEWTLQDKQWRPSRDYLLKLLAAYKELGHQYELLKPNDHPHL